MHLEFVTIPNFKPTQGNKACDIRISYEVFGQPMHSAPIVLVNHALTGNSDIASLEKGWWRHIVGSKKLIDLDRYTVIAFNIPGNGYDGLFINNYKEFTTGDIAYLFHQALQIMGIEKLYAIIGGSLGGGIAWEMACLYPNFSDYIIPIASSYQANDWIIAHTYVQERLIMHSTHPLQDARQMALLFYRTPASLSQKFDRTRTTDGSQYNVASWLQHHGDKLEKRFDVRSYLLMNHLLGSINVVPDGKHLNDVMGKIKSIIIQISVNSDLLFTPQDNNETQLLLNKLKITNKHYQIQSMDGHDAFLIEHQQITQFLKPIFKNT